MQPIQQQQQQQQQQQHKSSKHPVQNIGDTPASSTEPADVQHLDEDDIRRRILEVKKQKKATTTSWSFVSSPYAIMAVFGTIVGAIICLSLVPEDSRFFGQNGQRVRSSESRASDSYGDDDDQEQQEMYYQQQQQQQRERQRQYEQKRRLDTEEDADSDWNSGEDDDRFYANSGTDKDDGDDDYAPWNDKPDKNAEPAPSRTHRVVRQRMAPPEAGEKLRV